MIVAGVTARAVVEPPSIQALAECVAELYGTQTPFAFAGGLTEIELGNAPRALDTLVRTTACNRVIDYAPRDQTITVEAGITLAALSDVLARERQFLAIDAPDPQTTTIGGAVATNLYGSRRLRYGGIKDVIVGVEIVRPDGVRARGGGKVVKNVAGFDMPKIMVGSLGTLGAIVSATFRVHPIGERRAAIGYRGLSVDTLMRVCDELVGEALVPTSVVAFGDDGGRFECVVTFEGFARGVDQQMKAATSIAFRLGLSAGAYAGPLTGSFDQRERVARRDAAWHVTFSAPPTALARFLAATPLAVTARVVYPMLGIAFVAADTLDAATIAAWRAALPTGSVVVNTMPAGQRGGIDAWGEPPASAIMRRLKANFDPKGLCNVGRFVGGL